MKKVNERDVHFVEDGTPLYIEREIKDILYLHNKNNLLLHLQNRILFVTAWLGNGRLNCVFVNNLPHIAKDKT